jgi:hypothetical protein
MGQEHRRGPIMDLYHCEADCSSNDVNIVTACVIRGMSVTEILFVSYKSDFRQINLIFVY